MGKDKVLDATDKETVNSYKRVKSKTHLTPCLFIILLAACERLRYAKDSYP